ncbi:hypothetical protein [Photobacterium nomapromontoriensis]|uniref:hypothetical protein n=1 Tax=Photobacterium nomapromontoriensis TaxID=2910237 RepID=UPI003D0F8D6F
MKAVNVRSLLFIALVVSLCSPLQATELLATTFPSSELRGGFAVEYRQYFQRGIMGQENAQPSVVLEPEWYWEWHDGQSSFTFIPFGRWDGMDDERTHLDIREAMYLYYEGDFEFRLGIGKVFWGVTESQHLVDVINQTDAVESIDGEEKLGQPMVQLSYFTDYGQMEGFVLPYFRERTFTGSDGRLSVPGVDPGYAEYESRREEKHIDYALRYTYSWSIWDLGLSYFSGTNRDPYFVLGHQNHLPLVQYYAKMDQIGLDLQGLWGDWLWKLEVLRRWSFDDHSALTGGFEYTVIGIADTVWDLGLLGEYLYDSRGDKASVVGQNDAFIGARWVLNDMAGTEVLVGISQDLDFSQSRTAKIEASSRINNTWKWNINAWYLESDENLDPTYVLRKDDFIELSVSYYF